MKIKPYQLTLTLFLFLAACSKSPTPSPDSSNGTNSNPSNNGGGITPPPTPVEHGFEFDETYKSTGTNATMSALRADGKLIIGNPTQLACLNADGSLDASFSVGSTTSGFFASVELQSDGKILLFGSFEGYNNDKTRKYIVRLNSDGSIDNTFKITATNKMLENASIAAVHVQNDGKILIGGSFNYVTKVANSVTYSDVGIIRLNADGTYDNKFKVDFGNTANVYAIKPSGDGKLYIGGYLNIEVVYTNGTWENFNNIVKINADGSLDKSFKWKTIYPPIPSCFAVQDDGKLLIGGGIAKVSNVPAEAYYGIVRVNKDGAIDTSFPRYGYGEVVTSLKILSDKVVFTSKNYEGKFYQKANAGIFILPKDFSFTNTFKSTQKFTYGDAYNVVEDANKNLIVVGKMYSVPVDVNPVFKGVVKLKYY